MTPRMTAEDKKWRADSDARTLMEAEAIKSDATRKRAAINAAKQIIKEKVKEVKAVQKLIKPTRRGKR